MASRRELLLGLGSATLAGLSTDLGLSTPAQAAGGWGRGRHSGLPFWLGAHGEIAKFEQLMPAGRTVDVVNLWEHAGYYLENAAVRRQRLGEDAGAQPPRQRSCQRRAVEQFAILQRQQFQCAERVAEQCCRGDGEHAPELLAATNLYRWRKSPPTGSPSSGGSGKSRLPAGSTRSGGAKFRTFKSGYFVKNNLRNIRIILRVAHELNTSTKWGDRGYRRSYGMLLLNSASDYQLVQEGLRRYMAVFLDVFGHVQSGIAGDFAYPADQLWPYWNTGPGHKGTVDVRLTCPSNAKLVGPDYYNFWPALLTEADWNAQLYARTKSGSPFGLGAWLSWANSIGRPLCLGEVGLMSTSMNNGGGRPERGRLGQPAVHH